MTIATRDVGSTEVKLRQGHPTLKQNLDFCYLPGAGYDDYRAWNAGKLVPAGSDIIVSLHYTTNGKAVTDRTKIGFTVAKTPPPKKFVVQGAGEDTPVTAPTAANNRAAFASAYNPEFAIPPNARRLSGAADGHHLPQGMSRSCGCGPMRMFAGRALNTS